MKKILFSIMTSAVLVSCGTTAGSSAGKAGKAQPSIANTKWTLADNVKGKTPTLNIDGEKVNGNGGCNSYFGTLMTDASTGTFNASQLGSTKMACENMAVESNFMSMMQKANRYVVNGNTLELYQDNLLLLKFNKAQ